MITRKELKAAAQETAARARAAGKKGAQRLLEAADAALIEAGRRAQGRVRKRAVRRALKTAGKAAVLAGVTAAGVVAARALVRGRRAVPS